MVDNQDSTRIGGFVGFIREQGIVGLAIGVVIGVAVKDTVDSIVQGFINPLIGLILPNAEKLSTKTFTLAGSVFAWGSVLLSLINLTVIAAIVYFILKAIRLDQLDKTK